MTATPTKSSGQPARFLHGCLLSNSPVAEVGVDDDVGADDHFLVAIVACIFCMAAIIICTAPIMSGSVPGVVELMFMREDVGGDADDAGGEVLVVGVAVGVCSADGFGRCLGRVEHTAAAGEAITAREALI